MKSILDERLLEDEIDNLTPEKSIELLNKKYSL